MRASYQIRTDDLRPTKTTLSPTELKRQKLYYIKVQFFLLLSGDPVQTSTVTSATKCGCVLRFKLRGSADKRIRTSTLFRALPPQGNVSTVPPYPHKMVSFGCSPQSAKTLTARIIAAKLQQLTKLLCHPFTSLDTISCTLK